MTVITQNNQSLFDLGIQLFGNPQAVFDIANANGLGITDRLTAGKEIIVPQASAYKDDDIAGYYVKNSIVPVTAEESITTDEDSRGIGAMIVESTFIVE